MSEQLQRLRQEYIAGLQAYLLHGGEGALSQAYELGRRAMVEGLGVLDMAALHREVIDSLVLSASAADRAHFAHAAAEYFNELLSPFEMSFRGYRMANEDLQRLNEALRHQKTALENVNRELESFSYSVSHDLRAPLRAIDGFGQLLADHCGDRLDAEGKRYLRFIREATARMAQLIEDLLSLAKVTRGEMVRTQVDLTALARSIADRLHTAAPERSVEFSIEAEMRAWGDVRLLAVLLENLLGNAWKFTSKRADARIEFGCQQEPGRTVYFVRDNGAGFDMARASKLFTAFSRMHSTEDFEGTGIGLATVQRIVHRHGGEIWAHAESGRGATFFFTLGRAPDA